ncbi:hypothetical protein E2320_001561, partial [Naja naja]
MVQKSRLVPNMTSDKMVASVICSFITWNPKTAETSSLNSHSHSDEKVDEVTVPKAPAELQRWCKIHAGPKYDIRQDGGVLLIHNLEPQDSGEYSCI